MNTRRHQEQDGDGQDDVERTGQVRFDDRGNAVWETARGARLDHPSLELTDEPSPLAGLKVNRNGLSVGYDPYRSGAHAKEQWRKKKDLRALSKWIQLKRTMAEKAQEPPGPEQQQQEEE